ncbi:hypothetical protein, partial [Escherichia coli]|uniref:hypothetical protein n=1 Tax=Escherichia coli TaxID=562 RepID=UPI003F483E74
EEFIEGVRGFLEYSFNVAGNSDDFMIRFPCKKCKLRKFFAEDTVGTHLCQYGFKENYYVWELHGET